MGIKQNFVVIYAKESSRRWRLWSIEMDLNRLTEQSQEALRRAQELALRRNHQGIDAAHLLLALFEDASGLAARCLAAAGIVPSAARERVEQELNASPQVSGPGMEVQQVYFAQRLARLLTQAEVGARRAALYRRNKARHRPRRLRK